MTPAAEYAFVSGAQFVGDATSASSPSVLTAARTLAPTFALNQLGYIARAFSLSGGVRISDELRSAKAVVFNASDAGSGEPYAAIFETLKAAVFYDLAELPQPGTREEAGLRMRELRLTAASEYVAEEATALSGRPVRTVVEPVQGIRGVPRAPQVRPRSKVWHWLAGRAGLDTGSWRLRVFWCGDSRDGAAMLAALPELATLAEKLPLRLHCMAPPGGAIEQLAREFPAALVQPLQATLEAWSPQAAQQALAACDVVLLPEAGAAARSRVVSALHAGRFCVARTSPHLGPLAGYAFMGEELAAGLLWAVSNPDQVLSRLTAGQRYLDAVHAPDVVARAWIELFMSA